MKNRAKRQRVKEPCLAEKRRRQMAEARVAHAEARVEHAKTRIEQVETRVERAETRTEHAKTRAEQAEIRAEQAEMALQRLAGKEILLKPDAVRFLKNAITSDRDINRSLEKLTVRQQEILRLIAEGRNTKQIADILEISPKTVEYHRLKLMKSLKLHDVPGLVRFALRVGLVPHEH